MLYRITLEFLNNHSTAIPCEDTDAALGLYQHLVRVLGRDCLWIRLDVGMRDDQGSVHKWEMMRLFTKP